MRKGRKVEDIAGLRQPPQTCNIIHYETLPQQGIFVPEINKMLGEPSTQNVSILSSIEKRDQRLRTD